MLFVGCHLSSSHGYLAMGQTAQSIGATTLQFFTRNPRGSKVKAMDYEDAAAFNIFRKEHGFGPIIAHAPYTINPCSADEKVREFAIQAMADDLARLEYIDNCFYNFHPGSHVGQGIEIGIDKIAQVLNSVIKPGQKTPVLLETMAGKGSEVGSHFEELRAIIDAAEYPEMMGVCMDLCHVSDAGYDVAGHLDEVLTEFDQSIGLERLKALHMNDSKNPCGSHKDRHACIDEGYLGLSTMCNVINHPQLKKLPMILETPNELEGYAREIRLLREHCK